MSAPISPCVVIGGGISGLSSAASLVLEAGVQDVIVLEAKDRLGGRLWTSAGIDLGGAFVGPCQNRLLRLARSLGVLTRKVRTEGQNVLIMGEGKRATYTGSTPPLDILPLLDVNHLLCETERLASEINPDDVAGSPLKNLDQVSVAQWVHKEAQTQEGAKLYTTFVKALACVEAEEASMFEWLSSIAGCGPNGLTRALETDNGAQERIFVGGAQTICTKLAEKLTAKGCKIHLEHVVSKVDYSENGRVSIICENGEKFVTEHLIIAVPPAVCNAISFTPKLPAARQYLQDHLPMGRVIKISVEYKSPFWRENGRDFSGAIIATEGPIISSFALEIDSNNTTTTRYLVIGFCVADNAAKYGAISLSERRAAVLDQYAKAFACETAKNDFLDYHEVDWSKEKHVDGGYCGFAPTGSLSRSADSLVAPLQSETGSPAVHWASTETATRWKGYMDGAIQAGERAAHEVLMEMYKRDSKHIATKPAPFGPIEKDVSESEDCLPRPIGPSAFERMLPRPNTFLGIVATTAVAIGAFVWRRYL